MDLCWGHRKGTLWIRRRQSPMVFWMNVFHSLMKQFGKVHNSNHLKRISVDPPPSNRPWNFIGIPKPRDCIPKHLQSPGVHQNPQAFFQRAVSVRETEPPLGGSLVESGWQPLEKPQDRFFGGGTPSEIERMSPTKVPFWKEMKHLPTIPVPGIFLCFQGCMLCFLFSWHLMLIWDNGEIMYQNIPSALEKQLTTMTTFDVRYKS